MKKKILLAGAVALMAAAAVTGYSAYSKSNVSDLLCANVEALTQYESTSGKYFCVGISGPCVPEVGNIWVAPRVQMP